MRLYKGGGCHKVRHRLPQHRVEHVLIFGKHKAFWQQRQKTDFLSQIIHLDSVRFTASGTRFIPPNYKTFRVNCGNIQHDVRSAFLALHSRWFNNQLISRRTEGIHSLVFPASYKKYWLHKKKSLFGRGLKHKVSEQSRHLVGVWSQTPEMDLCDITKGNAYSTQILFS